jgi:hypothetical protein
MSFSRKVEVRREKRYQGMGKSTSSYFAYLGEHQIANDSDKDVCQAKAYAALYEAYQYVGSTAEVRVASDGTILVVRVIGEGIAQVEHHRNGKSSGISIGQMTNGLETFRSVREYADYCLKAYNS